MPKTFLVLRVQPSFSIFMYNPSLFILHLQYSFFIHIHAFSMRRINAWKTNGFWLIMMRQKPCVSMRLSFSWKTHVAQLAMYIHSFLLYAIFLLNSSFAIFLLCLLDVKDPISLAWTKRDANAQLFIFVAKLTRRMSEQLRGLFVGPVYGPN